MADEYTLLDDREVADFVIRGFHVLPSLVDAERSESLRLKLDRLEGEPTVDLFRRIRDLARLTQEPKLIGALESLLGTDFHIEERADWDPALARSMGRSWYRHDQDTPPVTLPRVVGLYFPHACDTDTGHHLVLPGSHLRTVTMDTLAMYGCFQPQQPLAVPAGTFVLIHPNLWLAHAANPGRRIRHSVAMWFHRVSPPRLASWNSNPNQVTEILPTLRDASVGPGSPQDRHLAPRLRIALWHHLAGRDEEVDPR